MDLEKNHYWQLRDERTDKRWIVEFPVWTFKGNQQNVTRYLLTQYHEWNTLIFSEWENKFGGRVIEVNPAGLIYHLCESPLADQDRIYFIVWPDHVPQVSFAVKQHKKYKKKV